MPPPGWSGDPPDRDRDRDRARMGAHHSADRPAPAADTARPRDRILRQDSPEYEASRRPSVEYPLRRAPSEYEQYGVYRPHDDYRQHNENRPRGEHRTQSDYYRPRRTSDAARSPLNVPSPPNARQSLKRPRHLESISPPRYRSDRPTSQDLSGRHVPLTKRRRTSGSWQSSPSGPSASFRAPRESHDGEMARPTTVLHRNLSWFKPPSAPSLPSAPQAPPSKVAKVVTKPPSAPKALSTKPTTVVNGVKYVPKGPSSWKRPSVDAAVERLPHIFIAAEDVPAVSTTKPHLHKMLMRCSPQDLIMNNTGWFITFEDSARGRNLLKLCITDFQDKMLFGKYHLRMEVFDEISEDRENQQHEMGLDNTAHADLIPGRGTGTEDFDQQTVGSPSAGIQAPVSQKTRPERSTAAQSLAGHVRSSPATSRPDKDDTASSISGLSSTTGARACHICKGRSGSPIKCTTCSRRYHRSCHTSKAIPDDNCLDDWQCQRCIRKGIPSKRLSSVVTTAVTPEELASVGFTDHEDPQQDSDSPKQVRFEIRNRRKTAMMQEADEADDLVERSFTTTEPVEPIPVEAPSKKPMFVRKKISTAPEASRNDENHPMAPKRPDLGESPADIDVTSPVDSVVQAPSKPPSRRSLHQKVVLCSQCHSRKVPRHPSGISLCMQCKRAAAETKEVSVESPATTPANLPPPPSPPPPPAAAAAATSATAEEEVSTASHKALTHEMLMPVEEPTAAESSVSLLSKDQPSQQCSIEQTEDSAEAAAESSHDRHDSESPVQRPKRRKLKKRTFFDDLAEASQPLHTAKRKMKPGIKRTIRRSIAKDEFDLGDSHSRPKGTYWRLMALALCDAPGKRLQPIAAVEWIRANVPGYSSTERGWGEGVKSTMIMNVQGKVGRTIAKRIKWQKGDGGKESADWYELLPNAEDTLEHWDHVLKRPIPPIKVLESLAGQMRNGTPSDVDDDSDSDSDKPLAKIVRPSLDLDHTVMAEDVTPEHVDEDESDSEPLASRRKRPACAPIATMISTVTPMQVLDHHMEIDVASPSTRPLRQPLGVAEEAFLLPTMPEVEPMVATSERDEAFLLSLVSTAARDSESRKTSFYDIWPEYQPGSGLAFNARGIEARPSRKEIFGTAPVLSQLENVPFPAASLMVEPVSRDSGGEVLDDNTLTKLCNNLDEFFDVREAQPLVPVMVDRQLAFRPSDARSRKVYKLGI